MYLAHPPLNQSSDSLQFTTAKIAHISAVPFPPVVPTIEGAQTVGRLKVRKSVIKSRLPFRNTMALQRSRRAGFASLAALLLLACCAPQHTSSLDFEYKSLDITSDDTVAVVAADQVSSNQAFSKTWQVKKSASASVLDEIKWMVPGRVFISYAESASSDLLAEVVVSGSSKEVVELVDMYSPGGLSVEAYGLTDELAVGGYLLTEIKVHQKRTVKKIHLSGSGESVILENVLYTKTKEAFAALTNGSSASSGTSDFKLTEGKPSTGSRTWNMTASDKYSKVSLDLSIPGKVQIATLKRNDASPGTLAKITLTEQMTLSKTSYTKIPVDKLEIVANANASDSTEYLAFRVKSSFNGNDKDLEIVTFIDVLPTVQLSVSNSVVSEFGDIRSNDPTDGLSTYFLMEGNGSVFISDKEAKLFFDGADFTGGNGNLQVDVGEISSTSMTVSNGGEGAIDIFAESITVAVPISASVWGDGSICLSSANDLKVVQLDPAKYSQLSYPGKSGASKCVKRELPIRVPGKTVLVKYGDDSSSGSTSSSTSKPKSKSSTAGSASSASSGVVKAKDSAAAALSVASAAVSTIVVAVTILV